MSRNIVQKLWKGKHRGILVRELSSFWGSGKDDHNSVCVGKMATVMFVTQSRVCKQKQILPNDSVCEPNDLLTKAFVDQDTTVFLSLKR